MIAEQRRVRAESIDEIVASAFKPGESFVFTPVVRPPVELEGDYPAWYFVVVSGSGVEPHTAMIGAPDREGAIELRDQLLMAAASGAAASGCGVTIHDCDDELFAGVTLIVLANAERRADDLVR